MTDEGLFDVAELLGPFPAIVLCEEPHCGGWRKVTARTEAEEFTAHHTRLHGGRAAIGCWPQRDNALAVILGASVDEAGEEHTVRAVPAVVDLAAYRQTRYAPQADT